MARAVLYGYRKKRRGRPRHVEHVRAVPSADPRGTQLHAGEIKLGRGVPVHLVAGVARWRFFEARKTRRQIELMPTPGISRSRTSPPINRTKKSQTCSSVIVAPLC